MVTLIIISVLLLINAGLTFLCLSSTGHLHTRLNNLSSALPDLVGGCAKLLSQQMAKGFKEAEFEMGCHSEYSSFCLTGLCRKAGVDVDSPEALDNGRCI